MFLPSWHRIWPAGACVVFSALLWLYVIDRWQPADVLLPVRSDGDWLEAAARVQVAAEQGWREGDTYGVIDRLGAPAVADWTLYPIPDRLIFWLAGRLANGIGVYGAINVMAGLALMANALGFLLAARLLRWPPVWGVVGALLFAFSTYNLGWALLLSLGLTFPWPVTLVVLHWAGRRRPVVGGPAVARRWILLAAATGLCLGMGNPYFGFLAGQLGLLALLRQWRSPHRARQWTAGAFVGSLVLAFVVTHAATVLARLQHPDTGVIRRVFMGTELYALRPIEWLMPPDRHWVTGFARWAMHYRNESMFGGYEHGAYLGVVALAGLALLAVTVARRALGLARAGSTLPIGAWTVAWVLLFSLTGGLNTLLGLLGLDVFRATLRYGIVPGTIGLFWALTWLRRRTATRPRLAPAAAIALVVFGLFDQTVRPPRTAARAEARAKHEQRQTFAAALTASLGPGASVFMLPAVPFPEAPRRERFPDYEHVHLFLGARTLRLSYGGLADSYPERLGHWLEHLPADELMPALAAAGFNALLIDQRAYRDQGRPWIDAARAAGHAPLDLPAAGPVAVFPLTPAPADILPGPGDVLLQERWYPGPSIWPQSPVRTRTPAGPVPFANPDWEALETDSDHRWRWAKTPAATIRFHHPATAPQRFELRCRLFTIGRTPVTLFWNDAVIWTGELAARTPVDLQFAELVAAPGSANTLRLEVARVQPARNGDSRPLCLRVVDLTARYAD